VLELLRIRNLAIIDELEVEFGPGLNVVTGETGAGKSILVGALQLVLGARARADAVRTGAERAEVEALFRLDADDPLVGRLAEAGIDCDGELVVRRVVEAGGRTRATLNGRMVTVAQLEGLARGLVDISSQHEHQRLADAATHLGYLDAFAGLDGLRAQVGEAVAALSACVAEAAAVRAAAAAALEREELLRFQLAELERLDPRPDEDAALQAEIGRLRHADALRAHVHRAEELLYSGDGSVTELLARVTAELEAAARIDGGFEAMLGPVAAARAELEDAARALGRGVRGVRADPERLAEAEERLHQLRRLARRYGTLEAAAAQRDTVRAELAALDGTDARLEALEAAHRTARAQAGDIARTLRAARQEHARRLGGAISAELASLGMGEARVEVAVAPLDGDGALSVDGARLGPTGMDRVEFLIATNPGEDPRPLRRVASGGELSRALLALKRVLAGLGPVGTYVFDEVDTGVGGAVAATIGGKLAEVAAHHQVLCITHLPQVAACGDVHLHVRKDVRDGRTRSQVHRLDAEMRVEELARMLGGAEVTRAARDAARELMAGARGR
jgi:DNA repair protein RecN (Recombination protein N)